MKPSILKASIKVMLEADQPVMIWGSPGNGKSSMVYQVAKELDKNSL